MNQHVPFPLDPNLQRLVREPLSEPPPLAREHWKTLAKAMERLDQARVQQATYGAEIVRLREELGLARQRDQQALGRALAAGEPEPESEAAGIEAEIERNTKREAAMTDVIIEAQRDVAELILRNKDGWAKDLARHIADTAAVYRTAIVEMERAREALIAEVQLGAWLAVFPGTGGQPQIHQLPGAPDEQVGGPAFNSVRDALLRDSEQLPLRGPVQPTREFLRLLERKQLVVDRVDADGTVHPQVIEGDTRVRAGLSETC